MASIPKYAFKGGLKMYNQEQIDAIDELNAELKAMEEAGCIRRHTVF